MSADLSDRPLWYWTEKGHLVAAGKLPAGDPAKLYCREGGPWSPVDPTNLPVIGGAETIQRFMRQRPPKLKGGI